MNYNFGYLYKTTNSYTFLSLSIYKIYIYKIYLFNITV